MKRQVFSISVGRDINRVKEAFEKLFLIGFVFSPERFKTWIDVRNAYWESTLEGFTHLLINEDEICRMVIHPFSYYDRQHYLTECVPMDLDDFVTKFKEGIICL